jgi:hypothetical protein
MLHLFNHSLDSRLSQLRLPASVQISLANQRINLAAIKIPKELAPPLQQPVRQSINESFVHGFHGVMVLGAALALMSGITSLLLISGRATRAQPPGA